MLSLKKRFPIFQQYPDLVYLDSAATTQKPATVITAEADFYRTANANIHRGVYDLSHQASKEFETVRKKVARFLGSDNPDCIAFTKGTTEAINWIAFGFLANRLQKGDNVVVTLMEHHANFIPWQQVCKQKNATLRVAPLLPNGDIDLQAFRQLVDDKTRLVGLVHVSNTIGTVNPIADLIEFAHKKGVPVLIDAAQSAACYDLPSEEMDFDFLAFSAHKVFGPFGVGVLFAKEKYHTQFSPTQFGGGAIQQVELEETHFKPFPYNLEAGTPNVAGVIAFGAAIDFIDEAGKKEARNHIHSLTEYGCKKLSELKELNIVGSPRERSGILSFTLDAIHPHDAASFLNKDQIAVRAGTHCTQPLLHALDLPATIRASFSVYTTKEDIDRLHDSLKELIAFWKQ